MSGFDLTPEDPKDTSFLNAVSSTIQHVQTEADPRPNHLTKGDVFRQLNARMQINEYGVPDFIYRADLIPADIYQLPTNERRDILDSAIIPITFEYGYPAVGHHSSLASPLWERLPGESQEAYDAFCAALDLPEVSKSEHPVRMLPLLAPMLKLELPQLAEYTHVYYWFIRFRAYDVYLAACHRKQREQRVMSIEGKHYRMAENYLAKVDKVLEAKLDAAILAINNDDENGDLADVKLKDLVDMVEKLTRIQRISVGLPANGNDTSPTRDIGGRMQEVGDAVKEIAQHAAPAKKTDNRSADMDALLQSPEDLANMQDLIIKMHQ